MAGRRNRPGHAGRIFGALGRDRRGSAPVRRALDRHQMGFALGEALAHLNFLMCDGALDRLRGEDGVDRFICETTNQNGEV